VTKVQTPPATLTPTLDETRRIKIDKEIRKRDYTDFGMKAWIHANMMSSSWLTTCPKDHSALNTRQFPVVA
jgi:hypothetical protein